MQTLPLGALMVSLPGTKLDSREKELLSHPNVGGVILFDRNYEHPQQLSELTAQIHALRQPQLLIAVDHEGGRVQRFREGFSLLPPMRSLGDIYDTNPAQAAALSEQFGWLMAAELRACGVDISFSPVLDLDYGVSDIIGNRSFHSDFQVVAELARAYMRGMRRAGMAAVGKHFPGHGGVTLDTHTTIVHDTRPLADIQYTDMAVFERMIHYGLPGIMTAHVVYPALDSMPASLSDTWINQILWKELKFEGAVFSDDMMMHGVVDLIHDPLDRCQRAIDVGSDMVLLCNDDAVIEFTVDRLKNERRPSRYVRLGHMHGRPAPSHALLKQEDDWLKARESLAKFSAERELRL